MKKNWWFLVFLIAAMFSAYAAGWLADRNLVAASLVGIVAAICMAGAMLTK